MATKTKQLGVRLPDQQTTALDEIASNYNHTPAGLVCLAVEQLTLFYKKNGYLPGLREVPELPFTDKKEASLTNQQSPKSTKH